MERTRKPNLTERGDLRRLVKSMNDAAEPPAWRQLGRHRAEYDGDETALEVVSRYPDKRVTRIYDISRWGRPRLVSKQVERRARPLKVPR